MKTEDPSKKRSLLYVHDHRFGVHDGRVYSRSAYPSSYWDRYREFFSKIEVIGRGSRIDKGIARNLDLSDHPAVRFELISEEKNMVSALRCRHNRKCIRRLVRQSDAIILRIPNRYALITARMARRYQKPIGIELSGCAWDAYWNHGSLLAKLYAPLGYLAMRNVAKMADCALYVTKSFLQRRYPTGADASAVSASNVEIFSTIPVERGGYLSRRIKDKDRLIFGTIGNYRTGYKGIQDAISALGKLKARIPDFEYRILGSGDPTSYKAIAANCGIAERVKFDGTLPRGDRVLQWLDGIDIYLQPSHTEGLPRALVEAMSRGKVAIGSTVGGIPELLPPDFMHTPGDRDELSHRIVSIFHRDDLDDVIKKNINVSREYLSSRLQGIRNSFLQCLVERGEST